MKHLLLALALNIPVGAQAYEIDTEGYDQVAHTIALSTICSTVYTIEGLHDRSSTIYAVSIGARSAVENLLSVEQQADLDVYVDEALTEYVGMVGAHGLSYCNIIYSSLI